MLYLGTINSGVYYARVYCATLVSRVDTPCIVYNGSDLPASIACASLFGNHQALGEDDLHALPFVCENLNLDEPWALNHNSGFQYVRLQGIAGTGTVDLF